MPASAIRKGQPLPMAMVPLFVKTSPIDHCQAEAITINTPKQIAKTGIPMPCLIELVFPSFLAGPTSGHWRGAALPGPKRRRRVGDATWRRVAPFGAAAVWAGLSVGGRPRLCSGRPSGAAGLCSKCPRGWPSWMWSGARDYPPGQVRTGRPRYLG